MTKMSVIVFGAKKNRAALLKQFEKKVGWTVTEFAESKGVTRARMSRQLIKARKEREKEREEVKNKGE